MRAVVRSKLGGNCRLRTAGPVLVSEGTSEDRGPGRPAAPTPIRCSRTVAPGRPLLAPGAQEGLPEVKLRPTQAVDFATRAGGVYTHRSRRGQLGRICSRWAPSRSRPRPRPRMRPRRPSPGRRDGTRCLPRFRRIGAAGVPGGDRRDVRIASGTGTGTPIPGTRTGTGTEVPHPVAPPPPSAAAGLDGALAAGRAWYSVHS